jgi:hypothetical protein
MPNEVIQAQVELAGLKWTASDQCKMYFGQHATACRVRDKCGLRASKIEAKFIEKTKRRN